MALIFHFRRQDTFLGTANPMTKLLLLVATCLASSGASMREALFLLALLSGVMLLIRLPLFSYGRDLRFFLIMGLLILTANGLSSHDWLLASLYALRFLLVILAAIIFSDTTDFWDLSCAIAPILDWLPFVHGWRVASTIQLAIMLVPTVFEATSQVRDAQASRGAFHASPVKVLATYVSQVMDTLIDKLDEVSDSIEARLFDPDLPRQRLSMHINDFLLLFLGAILLLARYLC